MPVTPLYERDPDGVITAALQQYAEILDIIDKNGNTPYGEYKNVARVPAHLKLTDEIEKTLKNLGAEFPSETGVQDAPKKRPVGRPRSALPPGDKGKMVSPRFATEEFEEIQRRAKAEGTTPVGWVRNLVRSHLEP